MGYCSDLEASLSKPLLIHSGPHTVYSSCMYSVISAALEIKAIYERSDGTRGPSGEKVIWGYNTTQPAHDEKREGK